MHPRFLTKRLLADLAAVLGLYQNTLAPSAYWYGMGGFALGSLNSNTDNAARDFPRGILSAQF